MQREVDLFLDWSQVRKSLLDIGEHVVGNGNDEQGIFSQDPCSTLDGFLCEAAVALVGNGSDFVVLIV
jgi:hypothetical protein